MALDVYVGSLTNYYARAAVERNPDHLLPAILTWRSGLSERLGDTIAGTLDWDETPGAPHFKGRLGWGGFAALVLWAAYAEHPGLGRASLLPDDWEHDPALARSNAEGFRSRYSHLVGNVELWLPVPFEFTFEGEDVDKRRIVVGSAATLVRQLADLNHATWKATETDIAGWIREPSGDDEAPLEPGARHAFAVMAGLARQAVEHRLPVKLDF